MKALKIVAVTILVCVWGATYAQTKHKKDTVYYLFDTTRVAPNDRMITVEQDGEHASYVINCPCLPGYNMIAFSYNNDKAEPLNTSEFRKIKFTHVSHLIDMAVRNNNDDFNRKFVVYFVEVIPKGYLKRWIHYSVVQAPINDGVSIPMDTHKPIRH